MKKFLIIFTFFIFVHFHVKVKLHKTKEMENVNIFFPNLCRWRWGLIQMKTLQKAWRKYTWRRKYTYHVFCAVNYPLRPYFMYFILQAFCPSRNSVTRFLNPTRLSLNGLSGLLKNRLKQLRELFRFAKIFNFSVKSVNLWGFLAPPSTWDRNSEAFLSL